MTGVHRLAVILVICVIGEEDNQFLFSTTSRKSPTMSLVGDSYDLSFSNITALL
jgi:hypothetical protein